MVYMYSGGQEVRDRYAGGVEAFARRNGAGHQLHGDHSRHRSSEDVPSSKDVVSTNCCALISAALYLYQPFGVAFKVTLAHLILIIMGMHITCL